MSIARAGTPGATRVCPHCKAVVLESAAVCPGCRHHLRFSSADAQLATEGYCAFNIEGTIAHKQSGEHCEYCIVLDIRNERGEQIIRQVVGVGALHPGELRRLSLVVEMLPVRASLPKPDPGVSARDPRAIVKPAAPAPAPAAASTTPAPARAPAAPSPPARPPSQVAVRPAATSSGKPAATGAAEPQGSLPLSQGMRSLRK
jgi:hypothetical protein